MLVYTTRPISDRTPFTGKHTYSDFRVTWMQATVRSATTEGSVPR